MGRFLRLLIFFPVLAMGNSAETPSFTIMTGFDPNQTSLSRCQATLIDRVFVQNVWRCMLATATHCLYEEGTGRAPAFIHIEGIGPVRGIAVRSRGKAFTTPEADIAVAQFADGCDRASRFAVVPIRPKPLTYANNADTPIIVSSRRDRPLQNGRINPRNRYRDQVALEVILNQRPDEGGVRAGDSGSGVFVRNGDKLELVGILSAMITPGVLVSPEGETYYYPVSDYAVVATDVEWLLAQLGLSQRLVTAPTTAAPDLTRLDRLLDPTR